MGAVHFSVDLELIAALQRALPLRVFVETGTFRGDTAAIAAQRFQRVFTIELDPELFAQAAARLGTLPNVQSLLGDSQRTLRELAPQLAKESVLYWLDAHWCGAGTGGQKQECPLLAELEAIGSLSQESALLIDDARLLLAPPPPPHDPSQWPQLVEVVERLSGLSPRHKIWIINDVLIFAPPGAHQAVVEYGRVHGVDLQRLVRAAASAPASPKDGSATSSAGAGFSAEFLAVPRSERIFAHHLERLGIGRVLDIGSNTGQFATKLRRLGYAGVIYSVEPQLQAYAQLLTNSSHDLRWFPLARQGAGARAEFCTLNLAENGWSSSLLEVHPNHIRAQGSTRRVGTETIYVNNASRLLRTELMPQIEALKIDVQGFEEQVIAGYLPFMEHVRLLLLELSVVECYRGGPDLFALDERLVKRHGFTRVSLEPSFYDEVLGVVQQYDGIYYRPERRGPAPPERRGARIAAVETSLAGIPQRRRSDGSDLGAVWLDTCWQSWRHLGERVVSVAEVAPPLQGVEWVGTQSRPSIIEMLRAIGSSPGAHVLLTNADIAFTDVLGKLLGELDSEAVYYGHRVEMQEGAIPGEIRSTGIYPVGFDYFLLPAGLVQALAVEGLPPGDFRIGEPWWDYLLPVLALARGFPLKKLPPEMPIALHYSHPTRYSHGLWLRNGELFLECVQALLRDPACYATGLLTDLAREGGGDLDLQARLERTARIVCGGLP